MRLDPAKLARSIQKIAGARVEPGKGPFGNSDRKENTEEPTEKNLLSNIPKELHALQQWVNFDLIDGKKVPFIPGSDSMASSNRPRDWRSFRAALADVESGKHQHVGFCLSSTDPYVFIDLDDPDDEEQAAVSKRINTYAQRSVSGEGCHLICRGTFQGSGKHPASPKAGIFKSGRFILMTGDIVAGRSTINAVAESDLQAVHSWLGGGTERDTPALVEYESELPDLTVIEMGCDRFTKFEELCCGRWQQFPEFHNDHSTADHAFIAMLCDLTESNEQVRNLFGMSGMWNAERAAKKAGHGFEGYVNRTISKIRGNQALAMERSSRVTLCFENDDSSTIEDSKDGFPTIRASEITGASETLDFVQGLLIIATMSVVFGPSNCGKSFWCLYLATCVAMGIPFFGREVEQGAVLYIGLEGKSGAKNRITAMKLDGLLSDDAPLHLCFSPLSLLERGHADLVAKTVAKIEREEGCKLTLIVIDTYSRAMAGGDENSGKDTSEVVATVDAIRAASDAHVMLIHHCGKDEGRGARGHSSLRAATDTEIEITRADTASPSVVSVKKQRDLPIAEITCFKLVPVHLGIDRRGDPITSCVVRHEEGCEVPTKRKGRPKKTTDGAILALLPKGSSTAWQMAARAELGVGRTAFYEQIKSIKASGMAIQDDKGEWSARTQFTDQFPNHESP